MHALRSIGRAIACVIHTLWRLDCAMNELVISLLSCAIDPLRAAHALFRCARASLTPPTPSERMTAHEPLRHAPSTRRTAIARGPAANAHALLASCPKRLANAHARNTGRKGVSFVVDSGCTWHIHPYAEDL
eukprot:1475490-Pleurochrysis_carterae.AAC.1